MKKSPNNPSVCVVCDNRRRKTLRCGESSFPLPLRLLEKAVLHTEYPTYANPATTAEQKAILLIARSVFKFKFKFTKDISNYKKVNRFECGM